LDRIQAAHPGKRLTLWFGDEARFGQKGRVCHRWFIRGQRPAGLCDQRYTWAHLFAAVRPDTGESFALVLPELSTQAMQIFLDGLAKTVPPSEHAALVVDQAGWHVADALVIPDNVSLILLPPYSPQLNPIERVWLFLRERYLSHRLLAGYNAIVDALCTAWNKLTPERLNSLTSYPYLSQVRI
jgi:transposase